MKWKEFLKPTKGKLIFSIVVTLLWIFLLRYVVFGVETTCPMVAYPEVCPEEDYTTFLIVRGSCPPCTNLLELLYNYLLIILLPFVILYFVYSIFSMFLFKKRK